MEKLWASEALLPNGWARDVTVTVDAGRIVSATPDTARSGSDLGILLPAPVNVHSHAFQRAMAGLTERRGPDPRDSFWTWRQLMFRFLDRLTPDDVQAITAFVQMEMLAAGYGASVEFHYLHHQPGGMPYDNLAEMSERVVAASQQSGAGLCLVPVHYQFGGCDQRDLGAGQVRFGNDADRFAQLHAAAGQALHAQPADHTLGAAPHSLRAVRREDLTEFARRYPSGPLHMHLAEQIPEVDEVHAAWGARPVDWALQHMDLDDRWCLIHCTQMTPAETTALAATGAVAGLCPITESSLGDGIFDGVRWFDAGGAVAIGSDSNIRISLSEELRTLDYSQRLRDGTRAALATAQASTGRRIFDAVLAGGAQAAGRASGTIAAGQWADMLALDTGSIHLEGRSGDQALDAWIFAGDDRLVRDVWSAGRHVVQDGAHIDRDAITVNRALCAVAEAGLLDRKRKAGTRVALQPVARATLSIAVIRQEVADKGARYGYRLLERKLARPPAAVSRALKTGAAALLHVRALHFADDVPYALEDRWINPAGAAGALDQPFDTTSANEWLLEHAPYTGGDIALSAHSATAAEAQDLNCAAGDALFALTRNTWNDTTAVTRVRLLFAQGYEMQADL